MSAVGTPEAVSRRRENARELFARRTTTDALRYRHTPIRSTMKVLIKPRLQKDKWSVYWKTSMATRTLSLDSFELDVDPEKVTGKELRATVAEAIGFQPEKTLCRLEGFVEPWELACVPTLLSPRAAASPRASPGPAEARSLRSPEAKKSRPFDFPRTRRNRPPTVLADRSRRVYPKVADAKRSPSSSSPVHAPLVNARTTAISLSTLPRRRSMYKGRELDDDKTLRELGVTEEGATIVTVRKVLIAEGWKIIQEDDEDSDTEEDDF